MATVRAAVIPAPNAPIELREFPEPTIEHGGAMLAVEWSEVCGTDVYLQQGRLAGVPYPLIPGHVTVGRLERIRGPLHDIDGAPLAEGDRVTFLDVHATCNACWHCLVAKASTRCPTRKVYGITYGADDTLAGGWADKVYLKPQTRLIPLGDASPTRFMAGGCSLPTALHAIERAEIGIGDNVLVLGTGPVGLSAIALARHRGAGSVLAIGAPADRLTVARAMGADATFDFRDGDEPARAWLREQTAGRGADVTIEASGAPQAVVQAMRCARDAGRVVVVGQYTDHGEVAFNPHRDLNKKHLEIRGCWGSDASHFYRAVAIARHATLNAPWGQLPTTSFALENAAEALAAIAEAGAVKALLHP